MEIENLIKQYQQQLKTLYAPPEAESLVYWLLEFYQGLNRSQLLSLRQIKEISPELESAKEKLLMGMPIQYITGTAPFYGRIFKVNPAVLIPRNETEELVHLIIQENPYPHLKILDVGTGTACIPITLALEMDRPEISAVDISKEALSIAQSNASTHDCQIRFYLMDVLRDGFREEQLDIIVSNPPHVRESEKAAMHMNILDHEPHLALFVPDDDPLHFYREIAQKGYKALKNNGRIYFEINEALGNQVSALLDSLGYIECRIIQDLNNKNRMVVAKKGEL